MGVCILTDRVMFPYNGKGSTRIRYAAHRLSLLPSSPSVHPWAHLTNSLPAVYYRRKNGVTSGPFLSILRVCFRSALSTGGILHPRWPTVDRYQSCPLTFWSECSMLQSCTMKYQFLSLFPALRQLTAFTYIDHCTRSKHLTQLWN